LRTPTFKSDKLSKYWTFFRQSNLRAILEKTFEIGRKYTNGFKENLKISFDDFLPKWNYVAVPT